MAKVFSPVAIQASFCAIQDGFAEDQFDYLERVALASALVRDHGDYFALVAAQGITGPLESVATEDLPITLGTVFLVLRPSPLTGARVQREERLEDHTLASLNRLFDFPGFASIAIGGASWTIG